MNSDQIRGQGQGPLDAALVLLRVALGAVFIAHGGQKLFQFGIAGTAAAFAEMGVVLPAVTAAAVAFIEFFGGILLVIGLFTRVAAAGGAVVMLGAMLMVHLPAGFFLPDGFEFVLVNFAIAVAIAMVGPGAYSLDAKRQKPKGGV
jgi:putative oxidoreductase